MEKYESKRQIYETAKALFYRNGYAATTMREIAAASGSSLGLPSYYFGSKENLGVEIYREYRYKLRAICQFFYPLPDHADDCSHLSTVADNALMLENETLKDLFTSVAFTPQMSDLMQELLPQNSAIMRDFEKFKDINALTVPAVKAVIIGADRRKYGGNITDEEMSIFLYQRYLRLQHPGKYSEVEALFHRYYDDYRRLGIRLTENFDLAYHADVLFPKD